MRRLDLLKRRDAFAAFVSASMLCLTLNSCAANKAHLDNEIEATRAGVDYGGCTIKVHAQDGGTLRDWEKCACEIDTAHHVDSGKCAP
jgi:hypothetical protein